MNKIKIEEGEEIEKWVMVVNLHQSMESSHIWNRWNDG